MGRLKEKLKEDMKTDSSSKKKSFGKKEHCFDMKINKSKRGDPLIIVYFKQSSNYWESNHSWCPTLDELEYLYKTKKMMEKT